VKRIYVARDAQDMRRGIDTLACVVEHELGHEPYAGDCFVFLIRDRRKRKVLIWEDGGFWLCLKRLVAGTFAAASTWCAVDAAASQPFIDLPNATTVRTPCDGRGFA
jgi:transposase